MLATNSKAAPFFALLCFLALAILNTANLISPVAMNTVWIASSLWLLADSVTIHQDMEVARRVSDKAFEDKIDAIVRKNMTIIGHGINNKLTDTLEQALMYICSMHTTQFYPDSPPPQRPVLTRAQTC